MLIGGSNLVPAETSLPRVGAPSAPSVDEPPEMVLPWLDEVRAQREAWEARRATAREQHEWRRRIHHPRGAAQQEAWEDDLRRRRAERQARVEQDREAFRRLGPGFLGPHQTVVDEAPKSQDPSDQASPTPSVLYPPGWNNLWYFRGY